MSEERGVDGEWRQRSRSWSEVGRGDKREGRRRNIVIKGVEVRQRRSREAVEELMEILEAKVDVEEVRRIEVKEKENK